MKVLVIGATGTIGSAVARALEASRHQVVKASRRGPVKVDIEDPSSLDALFDEVADLDAVVCCAAGGPLVDLESVTDEEIAAGVQGKLLGQVALERLPACLDRLSSPMEQALDDLLPEDLLPADHLDGLEDPEAEPANPPAPRSSPAGSARVPYRDSPSAAPDHLGATGR
ncbi:NAD-dependent epimerase/dehydratase family protein [Streptomyces sp. NPDC056844]|uniref:NAD-dependent epimerase/dehydratase family protein n=1 Tax=unclassified Streptomyces TaxID=2593676 RepID=UPI003688A4E4